MRGSRGVRGGFAMRGRQDATALVRSQFVDVQKTNSARRIQKDLKELEDNKHLLRGVSAAPSPNNLYQLCGNLRGPAGTKWETAVFHFQMYLPMNYPVSPPTITLCTSISHPNVFGQQICLDMLQKAGSASKIYNGWVPAYTIESILIQLQSFIFEEEWKNGPFHPMTPEDKRLSVKREIEAANSFKCPFCAHKGALEPFPALPKGEEDDKDYVMMKSPKDLLKEELLCFQTKAPLRDATLGIGISLKKSVRTLEIKYVNPTMDLISMRAFTKLKVRQALEGEKFSHWLPLYFGEDEEYQIETEQYNHDLGEHEKEVKEVNLKERFERHFFNSLAFIANGNIKKPIKAEDILAIFPRLITTHIVDLCKENRHTSIVAIRRLFNFMRLFHMCIKKYPKVSEIMDAKLKEFIEDPNKRLKDPEICPNLGDVQVFSLMSQTYNFEDIKLAYTDEQLDRQVFWMLQKVPELDFQNKKIKNKGKVSESKRMSVCFEIGKVGAQVTTFFYSINQIIQEKTGLMAEGRWDKLATELDKNHGCIDMDLEDKLQLKLKAALKMKSFEAYYQNLQVEIEGGAKGISEKLIQAVKNSRAKGYHDDDLDMSEKSKLAPVPDQSQNKCLALLSTFMDVTTEEYEQKQDDDIKVEDVVLEKATSIKSTTSAVELAEPYKKQEFFHVKQMSVKGNLNTDDDWKAVCAQNFPFIKQELMSNKDRQINAAKLAQMHDDMELYKFKALDEKHNMEQDKLFMQRRALLNKDIDKAYEQCTLLKDYNEETFTYKKLMIKLAFEELQKNVALSYNFEFLFEFIKLFVNDLESIKFHLLDTTHLKSNNYYLMAIIPKLVNLKIIKFYKEYDSPILGVNAINFLRKALQYFNQNNGKLLKFEFGNFLQHIGQDYMYGYLKQMPELMVLKINDFQLQDKDAKAIGKYLSDHLSLRELDLSYTQLKTTSAKEVADGLMRAKNIEIIKMKGNQQLDCSQVLYNLAFSPKIRHVDLTASCTAMSGNATTAWNSIVESIFKLLKISGSIQTILFGQTDLAKYMSLDLCKAIGESVSLQHLNIDGPKNAPETYYLNSTHINNLFKAIAMNAYKKGQLKNVSMKHVLNKQNIQSCLLQLLISDYDHEIWYGEQSEAKKMQKEQLEKKMHCALDDLDIGYSKLSKIDFSLKAYQKQKEPEWPVLIKFFAEKGLRSLQVPKCNISASAEIWNTVLGQNPVGPCKLQVLNLSSNDIGISGAKILAGAMEHNNSIEFLDVSNNDLQVYGSFLLCQSLQKNNTLKGLNLFKNFIDVDGCRAVRELIKVNQSIEFLDLGHNRIRAKGLEAIAEGINSSESCKLKTLGLRMNFLNDDSIQKFMNDVVFSNMSSLENIYIKYNNISQGKAIDLKAKLDQVKSQLYVDEFEKMVHITDEDRKKRTLWFRCKTGMSGAYIKQLLHSFKYYLPNIGLVKNFYFRVGHSIKGKTGHHAYFFIEFDDEKSMEKMSWLNKNSHVVNAVPYKVGSNTFIQIRKSVKGTRVAKGKKNSRK